MYRGTNTAESTVESESDSDSGKGVGTGTALVLSLLSFSELFR